MARPKLNIEERQELMIAAAARVFTRNGFRQTQMSNIARQMGVSVGSLYNWVDSKETLFSWCLAAAFEVEVSREGPLDPVPFLKEASQQIDTLTPYLDEALGNPPSDDFEQEITGVVGELFDFNIRYGGGVRLIEASTVDFPELSALYYEQLRKNFLSKIERYLSDRRDHGLLAETEDLAIMGRSLIELIAWWAIHSMNDPSRVQYNTDHLRNEVVRFAVRGLTGKG